MSNAALTKPSTLDSIMSGAKKSVEEGRPVSPSQWLDAAGRLAILIQDLDEELINAEMCYRELRADFIAQGESAAAAEVKAKATEAYRAFLSLTAKRERISWFIQISKKRVDLKGWDQ